MNRNSAYSESVSVLACEACSGFPFPLHRAAAYGHTDCLKKFLTQSKNRKAPTDLFLDPNGQTPLHVAAKAGQLGTLKYLIENTNVSPYHRNSNGETCAHAAVGGRNSCCIEYLLSLPICKRSRRPLALEKDARANTILHLAIVIADNDIAIWLLQTYGQAIANLSNGAGQLPLHIAAAQGNLEFIRTATKYDLQMVHKRDINGATPAFYAARGGNLPCLKYLVEKTRADVNAVTSHGHTLLHVASLWGHASMVQWLLITKKTVVSQKNEDNATAFHCAAFGGHPAVLHILLRAPQSKKKYVASSTDGQGNTCLHLAAMNDHSECVQYLLQLGANPKAKNKVGKTAFDLAVLRGSHQSAWLLAGCTRSNKKGGKAPVITQPASAYAHISPGSISSGYGSFAAASTPFCYNRASPPTTPSPWPLHRCSTENPYTRERTGRPASLDDRIFHKRKFRDSAAPMFFNSNADRESIVQSVDITGSSSSLHADNKIVEDDFNQSGLGDRLIDDGFTAHSTTERHDPVIHLLHSDYDNDLKENIVETEHKTRGIDCESDGRCSLRSLSISTDCNFMDGDMEGIAATEHIDRVLNDTATDIIWRKQCPEAVYSTHGRRPDTSRPDDLGPPMTPPILYDPASKRCEKVHTRITSF